MRMVKEGFESEYESLREKKLNLLRDKEEAIEKAKAEVEARFKDREETIESLLMLISDEVTENICQSVPETEVGGEELTVEEGQIENDMLVGVNEVPEGATVVEGVNVVEATTPKVTF